MAFYRHKISQVEAEKLTKENVDELTAWCNGVAVREENIFDSNQVMVGINVPCNQGNIRASEGDYILKNATGNFHVRSAINFEDQFEEAT